jgi:GTPase SAR1 family protein
MLRVRKADTIVNERVQLPAPSVKAPLNEGKIIVVGRGEVGKTSLINRLIKNRFNRDEKTTKGIFIDAWKLPIGARPMTIRI